MLNKIEDIIITNRKIINRLIKSEASVFCFYRIRPRKTPDILEIYIHNNLSGIEFRFKSSESELISQTFQFLEHLIDDDLWDKIDQEVKRKYFYFSDIEALSKKYEIYFNRKPEIYHHIFPCILNEEEIARFLDLNTFDLKNYYKFYTKEDFIKHNFEKEILEKRRYGEPYTHIFETKVVYKYGLILKERYFHRRYSDFGYENYTTQVMCDHAYFSDKPNRFNKLITPRDVTPDPIEFWSHIYSYFFNDKRFILVNYDDMQTAPDDFSHKMKTDIPPKLFCLPDDLLKDIYIISL